MRNAIARPWAVLLVALFTAVITIVTPLGSVANASLSFDTGHTDIFNVTAEDGKLTLNLKEDITGQHVQRAPEEVTLVVKGEAYQTETAQLDGIKIPGYMLPQVQDQNLLWPGWDTMGVQGDGFNAIDINFLSVQGPGKVMLYGGGMFGGLQPLLKDGFELKTGAVREQSFPAHTHAYWLFEKPGTYTMQVNATGAKNGQTVTSNTATYTWVVKPSAKDPNAQTPPPSDSGTTPPPTGGTTPPPNETSAPTPGETQTPPPANSTTAPVTNAPSSPAANAPAPAAPAAPAQATCFPHQEGGSGAETLLPRLKDDRTAPARWVEPESIPFLVGDKGKATVPTAIGSIPAGTNVWMIGSTQVRGVPWVGANTMNASVMEKTTGAVTWQLTSFSGPGTMEVFTSGGLGQPVGQRWFAGSGSSGSGAITIPRNTHVHPNWVFTAAGTYKVGITQTATKTDGTRISGKTTLTFNVGSGSGANDGHFDLGSEVGAPGSKTVWRDAKGEICIPTAADYAAAGMSPGGALATTGASVLTPALAVLAAGVAVLGVGVMRYRKAI